jgi:hypothetical protein
VLWFLVFAGDMVEDQGGLGFDLEISHSGWDSRIRGVFSGTCDFHQVSIQSQELGGFLGTILGYYLARSEVDVSS